MPPRNRIARRTAKVETIKGKRPTLIDAFGSARLFANRVLRHTIGQLTFRRFAGSFRAKECTCRVKLNYTRR
jgi:hypothetical protein